MTIGEFLNRLKGVKSQASGGWMAKCPAHPDRKASLSVAVGSDSRILITCFAGCAAEAITKAIGITIADLFLTPLPPPSKAKSQSQSSPEIAYNYRDKSGDLLFQVVRNPGKKFIQRAPDGAGGWLYTLKDIQRVPYRLPELIAADPAGFVFVCEGEKDCDRLRGLGFIATTNPGGAGKWRKEYSAHLAGRQVVILPDNDDPGRAHALQVAKALTGTAAMIRILELPGLPPKGDVSDWLDAGNDGDALLRLAKALTPHANGNGNGLRSICIADVQVEQVDWLWEKRIPRKLITILEGIEGVGKSTLLTAIATAVTCGRGLPDMRVNEPANVLWLSAEDDLGMMLKPRLLSAGADVTRVFAIGDPFALNDAGIELIRSEAAQYKPSLVIVDPLFAYTQGDPNKGADARITTNELKKLAESFGFALVLVRHVGKSKGFGDPRAAGMYSIEWRAAARSVLLAGCDPDNPNKRALTQTKNNLSELAESVGFVIESDADSPSGARFSWSGVSDLTARRILETVINDDDGYTRRDAEEFLRQVLSEGSLPMKEIAAEARSCGISQRTLERAKAALKIKSRKITSSSPWIWELPNADQGRQRGGLGQHDLSSCQDIEIQEQDRPRPPSKILSSRAHARAHAREDTLDVGGLGQKIEDKPLSGNGIDQDRQNTKAGGLGKSQNSLSITPEQRRELYQAGYSKFEVDKMAPDEAVRILTDENPDITPPGWQPPF